MEYTIETLNRMAKDIRNISDFAPTVGVVLGTGFSNFVNHLEDNKSILFKDIEDMPETTNPAHKGEFVIGRFAGVNVVCMNGRLHNYEGYTSPTCVLPVRAMCLLGLKGLVLTNAAGALNPKYRPGDLMIIEDQISQFVPSPLIGTNIEELGTRFPDMSNVYDEKTTKKIYDDAIEIGLDVKKGTYIQFRGPQYESKAESKLARLLGGDAVGMSTTTEAIAAKHMGIKTVGFSLITNFANGAMVDADAISDDDVLKVAAKNEKEYTALLEVCIKNLANA